MMRAERIKKAQDENQAATRTDLVNTTIIVIVTGGLAYMAFSTWWHTMLFAFIAFNIQTVGNRVVSTLRKARQLEKLSRLSDSEKGSGHG